MSSFHRDLCLLPWPWMLQVSRSNVLLAFNFIVPRPWSITLLHIRCRQTLMSCFHRDLCLWPWPWMFEVSRSKCNWHITSLYLDHGQWLFHTSDVERPWWVVFIGTFVCDLDLEGSKLQGQMCNWRFTSLYLDHDQLLFNTSDVDIPWWVLSIGTFVCGLDLDNV